MAGPRPEIRSGARKCGASLINLVFIDNARHSVVHPLVSLSPHTLLLLPLDPCIRQRFTFLEVRGAAIITRRDLFKGLGRARYRRDSGATMSVHSLCEHHIDVEIEQFPLPQGTQRIIYPG